MVKLPLVNEMRTHVNLTTTGAAQLAYQISPFIKYVYFISMGFMPITQTLCVCDLKSIVGGQHHTVTCASKAQLCFVSDARGAVSVSVCVCVCLYVCSYTMIQVA